MLDMHEIDAEITRLENSETTYHNCEKLSVLYAVRDGYAQEDKPVTAHRSAYSYASAPSSEFVSAVKSKSLDDVLVVLDDHMAAIQALYPKEYAAVIRKIKDL